MHQKGHVSAWVKLCSVSHIHRVHRCLPGLLCFILINVHAPWVLPGTNTSQMRYQMWSSTPALRSCSVLSLCPVLGFDDDVATCNVNCEDAPPRIVRTHAARACGSHHHAGRLSHIESDDISNHPDGECSDRSSCPRTRADELQPPTPTAASLSHHTLGRETAPSRAPASKATRCMASARRAPRLHPAPALYPSPSPPPQPPVKKLLGLLPCALQSPHGSPGHVQPGFTRSLLQHQTHQRSMQTPPPPCGEPL